MKILNRLLAVTITLATPALMAVAPLQTNNDFRQVAKMAIPAVVSIKVKGQDRSSSSTFHFGDSDEDSDLPQDEFWERFFGFRRKGNESSRPVSGQATGFLVSPDGYILTNSHVVKDMSEIIAVLTSGQEYKAKLVGMDSNTDVAIIKIEGHNLPYLKLANSDELEVGQWVAAIGNSLGLQASLTTGVVSAKGRNNLDLTGIEDYIQTDAAINRGNSGGPLVDLNGEVIGMNTAIVTNMANGGYMGVGFAIPSHILKSVMDDILAFGSFKRGFLGIALQPVDENLAQSFGLEKAEGALISDVSKESPAANAGLKSGDIVLKYNGQQVTNIGALRNAIAMMKPGSSVNLTLLRNGKMMDVKVQIGLFPATELAENASPMTDEKLGIAVENLTAETANKLGYTNDKGVVVSKVDPKSPAAWAGIKKGSLILEVNKKKISNLEEYKTALQDVEKGKPILFLLKQGELVRYVSFRIG